MWCTKAEFKHDTTAETLRKILVFWQTVRLTFQHRDQKFISRVKWRHGILLLSRMLKHSSLQPVPLSTPFSRTIKFHRGSQTYTVTSHCKTALKLEKKFRVSGLHYCSLNLIEFSLTNSVTVPVTASCVSQKIFQFKDFIKRHVPLAVHKNQ